MLGLFGAYQSLWERILIDEMLVVQLRHRKAALSLSALFTDLAVVCSFQFLFKFLLLPPRRVVI